MRGKRGALSEQDCERNIMLNKIVATDRSSGQLISSIVRLGLAVGLTITALGISSRGAEADLPSYCRSAPQRTDAIDHPSKHAWDVFLTLVHPARPIDIARG